MTDNDSMFCPNFIAPIVTCLKFTHRAQKSQNLKISKSQNLKISKSQNLKISKNLKNLKNSKNSKIQKFKKFKKFKNSKIQISQNSTLIYFSFFSDMTSSMNST
jgi:DUF1680 family protein